MSAGPFTLFYVAKPKFGNGKMNLSSDALKACLLTNVQTIANTFVGTSGNAQYSDLTNEVASGNGYTTGGVALTGVTYTQSSGTVTFTFTSPSWTSATFTAKYLAVYDNTATNKDLLLYCDLEQTSSTGVSVTNGTLTVTVPAGGVFTLT